MNSTRFIGVINCGNSFRLVGNTYHAPNQTIRVVTHNQHGKQTLESCQVQTDQNTLLLTQGGSKNIVVKRIKQVDSSTTNNDEKEENINKDYFTGLPTELLTLIFDYCQVSVIISLSQTCKRFYLVSSYDVKWKKLCANDFDVHLNNKGKFDSFQTIYRLLYSSRILLASYIYARYYQRLKIKIPSWLMLWAHLSQNPPIMKFGRDRIKRRINGSYLKKLHDIPHGQLRKTFDLKCYKDLMSLHPVRVERGTIYFSWFAVKFAGARKHLSIENYQEFLLNKCFRSRGFVERNYEKVRGTDPLLHL